MQELFEKATQQLKKYWGFEGFRPGQDDAVKSVLEGKDTLVLFPTGGGKSLCFQVPATVFEGITIVISPLVALMQDQVSQLKAKGISATFINSTLPAYEVEQRLVNARNGMYKLLYCAPERLKSPLFQAELERFSVAMIAVDEAHCISEWGHDFRPSYREIRTALEWLPNEVRWLALTATATPEVREDIVKNLVFKEPAIISKGFSRPNLKWWVIQSADKRNKVLHSALKASSNGDGLIYGGTRRNCEELARILSEKGLKTEAYHAGINAEVRKNIQQRWIEGETPLVVATNAFGMGIDKPDCSYVIHEEMPFSLEAYYQEAGRAGRNGALSYPILFYRESDFVKLKKRIQDNYPTHEELTRVYNALCDELNLAIGSEMEQFAAFEVERLKIRSGIPFNICKSALKLLDQFGALEINQDIPPKVGVQFTVSQSLLNSFKNETENSEKAEFLDKIERLFGHFAFSEEVELPKELVLDKLIVSENSLIKALNVLMQNDHLLTFSMYKQRDLVRVAEPRSKELPIAKYLVEQYRSTLISKLEYMNGYATTTECREKYLLAYFGEQTEKSCGICDNCLKNSNEIAFSTEELSTVFDLLIQQKKSVQEVRSILQMSTTTLTAIIHYLIKEKMIEPDEKRQGYYLVCN